MQPVATGWSSTNVEVGERRSRFRYPLSFPLVYVDGRRLRRTGRTIDISPSGLRLTAPELAVRKGEWLEVSVSLPGRCDGSVPVTLTLYGLVVWTNGTEAAVRSHRYAFEAGACDGNCRQCSKEPETRRRAQSSRPKPIVLAIRKSMGFTRVTG